MFFISRSSTFSVIHVNVDIKINAGAWKAKFHPGLHNVVEYNVSTDVRRTHDFVRTKISWIKGLQNSPYFCVSKYARAVKQKIWNEAENRERDRGETLFLSPHKPYGGVRLGRLARVRLLRHALPISLLILRKNRLFCSLGSRDNQVFLPIWCSAHESFAIRKLIRPWRRRSLFSHFHAN